MFKISYLRVICILMVFASSLLLAGCGVLDDSGGGDNSPPEFAGVVQAHSPYTDKITLGWIEAMDDKTRSENIKYKVYISTESDPASLISDNNNVAILEYETEYTISGLEADTTYYCLVVAEDMAGNTSTNNRPMEISTIKVNAAIVEKYVDAAVLEVDVNPLVLNSYTLNGDVQADISNGSVLVMEVPNEDGTMGYVLKEVASAQPQAGGMAVSTTNASLGDVISSGALDMSVKLPGSGVNYDTATVSAARQASGFGSNRYITQKYKTPDGNIRIKQSYPVSNNISTPVTRMLNTAKSQMISNVGDEGIRTQSGIDFSGQWTSSDGSFGLSYNFDAYAFFESVEEWREICKDVWWWTECTAKGELEMAAIGVGVPFDADMIVSYDIQGSNYKSETGIKLFEQKAYFLAFAGPVPVSTEYTLALKADVYINTGGTAQGTATASVDGEWFGALYYMEKQYAGLSDIDDLKYRINLTPTDINAEFDVVVRVYPEVKMTVYSTASLTANLIMRFDTLTKVQNYPMVSNPNAYQFNQLDVFYGSNYNIWADLSVFGQEVGRWDMLDGVIQPSIGIYSLPTISLSCLDPNIEVGQTTQCTSTITGGINNPVYWQQVDLWSDYSKVAIEIVSQTVSGNTKTEVINVTGVTSGSDTMRASAWGYSLIGPIGMQYADVAITVSDVDADGDGYTNGNDCNDSDPAINPSTIWYKDSDGDGYGDGSTITQCAQPAGYDLAANLTATSGDCDDTSPLYSPETIWYYDGDADGYGDGTSITQCAGVADYYLVGELLATAGDINDADATVRAAGENMVAYYPFNGNALDASGNSNDGTVVGPTLTTDRYNTASSAYDFDGINDYIKVLDSSSLDLTTGITTAAWVKPSDLTSTTYQEILRKTDALTPTGYLFSFQISGAYLTLGLNRNGVYESDTPIDSAALTDGSWHFVAGTYDGTIFKIYLDGVLIGTKMVSTTIGTNAADLYLGSSTPINELFTGALDEIRIYNWALSESGVQQLYSTP